MRTPCASATRSHTSSRPAAMRHDRLTHPVTRAISRHGSRARISTKTSSGNAARGATCCIPLLLPFVVCRLCPVLPEVDSPVPLPQLRSLSDIVCRLIADFRHSIWRAACTPRSNTAQERPSPFAPFRVQREQSPVLPRTSSAAPCFLVVPKSFCRVVPRTASRHKKAQASRRPRTRSRGS